MRHHELQFVVTLLLHSLRFNYLAGILDRGIQIDGLGMKSFMTYESNVLFALRFMIDCNVVGGNWIEVPAGKYKTTAKSSSYCQLEFDCLYPIRLQALIFLGRKFTINIFFLLFFFLEGISSVCADNSSREVNCGHLRQRRC